MAVVFSGDPCWSAIVDGYGNPIGVDAVDGNVIGEGFIPEMMRVAYQANLDLAARAFPRPFWVLHDGGGLGARLVEIHPKEAQLRVNRMLAVFLSIVVVVYMPPAALYWGVI